jgi:hypothetical protein
MNNLYKLKMFDKEKVEMDLCYYILVISMLKRKVFITWIVTMVRNMFLRQHGYPKPKVLTQLVK